MLDTVLVLLKKGNWAVPLCSALRCYCSALKGDDTIVPKVDGCNIPLDQQDDTVPTATFLPEHGRRCHHTDHVVFYTLLRLKC